ncbi:hypothetical protein [Bifidobacterium olomucense]|uniref:Uncharacterized protein n=1 Tax=Bifidobacterium olomucense TaxID=2675324 RepID=A0A7Y0EWF6_9BIFI|nr:hypothetical protein [Bifidobacterium sp. DSM 109959]NMM97584.1 hypothetical protein [Bifidobacterium sp. DSM 109959]
MINAGLDVMAGDWYGFYSGIGRIGWTIRSYDVARRWRYNPTLTNLPNYMYNCAGVTAVYARAIGCGEPGGPITIDYRGIYTGEGDWARQAELAFEWAERDNESLYWISRLVKPEPVNGTLDDKWPVTIPVQSREPAMLPLLYADEAAADAGCADEELLITGHDGRPMPIRPDCWANRRLVTKLVTKPLLEANGPTDGIIDKMRFMLYTLAAPRLLNQGHDEKRPDPLYRSSKYGWRDRLPNPRLANNYDYRNALAERTSTDPAMRGVNGAWPFHGFREGELERLAWEMAEAGSRQAAWAVWRAYCKTRIEALIREAADYIDWPDARTYRTPHGLAHGTRSDYGYDRTTTTARLKPRKGSRDTSGLDRRRGMMNVLLMLPFNTPGKLRLLTLNGFASVEDGGYSANPWYGTYTAFIGSLIAKIEAEEGTIITGIRPGPGMTRTEEYRLWMTWLLNRRSTDNELQGSGTTSPSRKDKGGANDKRPYRERLAPMLHAYLTRHANNWTKHNTDNQQEEQHG